MNKERINEKDKKLIFSKNLDIIKEGNGKENGRESGKQNGKLNIWKREEMKKKEIQISDKKTFLFFSENSKKNALLFFFVICTYVAMKGYNIDSTFKLVRLLSSIQFWTIHEISILLLYIIATLIIILLGLFLESQILKLRNILPCTICPFLWLIIRWRHLIYLLILLFPIYYYFDSFLWKNSLGWLWTIVYIFGFYFHFLEIKEDLPELKRLDLRIFMIIFFFILGFTGVLAINNWWEDWL